MKSHQRDVIWTRKSGEEIRAADREHLVVRLSPTRAIILALWVALAGLVLCIAGCEVTQSWWGGPATFLDAIRTFGKAFTAFFIIIYVVRLCIPEFLRTDNLGICPKCQMTFMRYKKRDNCEHCGALIEPMRHWRVEMEE